MIDSKELESSINNLHTVLKAEKASSYSYMARYADNAKYNSFKASINNLLKGRRGTGKTHMLKMLEEDLDKEFKVERKLAIFIDLRDVKSSNFNELIPAYEALECYRRFLYEFTTKVFEKLNTFNNNKLDKFILPISKENMKIIRLKKLKKDIEKYINNGKQWSILDKEDLVQTTKETNSVQGKFAEKPEFTSSLAEEKTIQNSRKVLRTFHFIDINKFIKELIKLAELKEIFLLLDEWSELPIDIQPYIAECFKSTFFCIGNCNTKIGMIPYRTKLAVYDKQNNPLGLEGSGEVFSIDLDDSLVLDRDKAASEKFFLEMLYKQLGIWLPNISSYKNDNGTVSRALISELFTNSKVFSTLVRASAGIPRDFLLIFVKSYLRHAGRKTTQKIGVDDIMIGAKEWYNNDKISDIKENNTVEYKLLTLISEFVLNFDKKRVYFLVHPSTFDYGYIKRLIDLRLLHRIKEMSSSKDNTQGIRYIMMALDFGCYVELLETKQIIDFNIENFEEEFMELNGDILDTNRGTIRKRVLPESIIEQHKNLIKSQVV